MTTIALAPTLQTLIDERLDGIDRVLTQSDLPRGERRAILDEVESQIHDMLSKKDGEPSRREVLEVLALIDPPEAYAKPTAEAPKPLPEYRRQAMHPAKPQMAPRWSMLAILAGVGGVVWIFGAIFTIALAMLLDGAGELVLFGGMATGAVAAIAVVALGITATIQIVGSGGRFKGLFLAVTGPIVVCLTIFNCALFYLMLASEELIALIAIPYLVLLSLGVAWAVFERFRYRNGWTEPLKLDH